MVLRKEEEKNTWIEKKNFLGVGSSSRSLQSPLFQNPQSDPDAQTGKVHRTIYRFFVLILKSDGHKRCKSYGQRRYNWRCEANPTDKYACLCSGTPSQMQETPLHWRAYLTAVFAKNCRL